MADSLDDDAFWLPPEILSDDDIFLETKKKNDSANKDVFGCGTEYAKPLLPLEFPYGFGSFGVPSDLSSPVESMVGSTEESDEEDYLTGLTCQMVRSTLQDDFKGNETTKGWVVSGSPQSTLCGVRSGCGCKSRGSPNSKPSSLPTTWDLLYAAAGEVAKMRMKEESGYEINSHSRGILGPVTKPSPVSVPVSNSNPDVGLYTNQSLSYLKLQASQFQQLRQQQLMKQQKEGGVWGGQTKSAGLGLCHRQQTQTVVQTRGRNLPSRPLGLSPSAWPPLQQAQQPHQHQGASGMRAVFLGNPDGKRECAGTGVFLPRRVGTPTETRKQPACSTVLVPARVVQALNMQLNDMGGQPQLQPRFNGNFINGRDNELRIRSKGIRSYNKLSLRPQPELTEVRLPQEWTY